MLLLLCLSTIVASMAQHNKGHKLKQNSHKHKLLRTSKSSDIRKKLHELNLLELLSVPGITNPSLLETSLSPSACQFSILENLHHDITLNCGDYRLNEKKYNNCRGPKLNENAERISSKCCRTCTQCSGCEGLDTPNADVYEQDSPGNWYSKRADVEDVGDKKEEPDDGGESKGVGNDKF
jgi:hypothetical protein